MNTPTNTVAPAGENAAPEAFYNISSRLIVDIVDPATGRGMYGGQTEAELASVHAPAAIARMGLAEAKAAAREARITPAEPITAEYFDDMLNVLPPVDWVRRAGIEHFFLSERVYDDIVQYCVRIGDRHWKFQDRAHLTTQEIAQRLGVARPGNS